MHGIAPDRKIDPFSLVNEAPYERDIFLLHFTIVELPRKLLMRRVVLGDYHHAGGPFVESMDDAGTTLAADAAQVRHVIEKSVHESAALVPRRRMKYPSITMLSGARMTEMNLDVESTFSTIPRSSPR